MKSTSEDILRTLRAQAWERAKGELQAVLQTFWGDGNFDEMNAQVEIFVSKVEDNGLQE